MKLSHFLQKKKLEDIYNPQYLEKLRTKLALTQPNINLLDCAKLNIPYIITFFGLGAQGKMSIMDIFPISISLNFIKN